MSIGVPPMLLPERDLVPDDRQRLGLKLKIIRLPLIGAE
jgi:hypothetical protein